MSADVRMLLESQLALLNDEWDWLQARSEGYYEAAHDYSVEGDTKGEQAAMQRMRPYVERMNKMTAAMVAIRKALAESASKEKSP